MKLKNLNNLRHRLIDSCDSDEDEFHSKNVLFPSNDDYSSDYDSKAGDESGNLMKLLVLIGSIDTKILSTLGLNFIRTSCCYNYWFLLLKCCKLDNAFNGFLSCTITKFALLPILFCLSFLFWLSFFSFTSDFVIVLFNKANFL